VDLQRFALSLVKPGNDDNFGTRRQPFKPRRVRLLQFDPGIGRTFIALPRRFLKMSERRTDEANRVKGIVNLRHNNTISKRASFKF
jgi:hypothetical protein